MEVRIVLSTALLLLVPSSALAQEAESRTGESRLTRPDTPPQLTDQLLELHAAPHRIPKLLGRYSREDWQAVIDATWGPGTLGTLHRRTLFLDFWNTIDVAFPCFQGLDVDWNGLRDMYLEEIERGVSKGRFAAIMGHLARRLMESHTVVRDRAVTGTRLDPGIPVMVVGGWGENGHFGAGLTPLPDRSLLVYQVVENHPLDLVPGDIVLGYDGQRWEQLYPDLIEAELPLGGFWWGSADSSYEHSFLMAAGMNWHLFDSIDVVKHDTGDIVQLPTALLADASMQLFATEQLPVPGVPKPGYEVFRGDVVKWGIVEGTAIGYIYVMGWFGDVEKDFLDAVRALTVEQATEGLIVDFRTNFGGNMFLSNSALEILFDQTVETIGFGIRCDPADRLGMCNKPTSYYDIQGDPQTSYNKPIAVLVGPGAISSGDQVALRLKFHPETYFFGKSTATAFNAPTDFEIPYSSWSARHAIADAYLATDPTDYLTHDEFQVDCQVWLEPDDVSAGIDTVVETAIDWILGIRPDMDGDVVLDACDNCVDIFNPAQQDFIHPNGIGDHCEDPDGDGVLDITDNCPDVVNVDQMDGDVDLVGNVCDICPEIHNPDQQESVACLELVQDGGACLEAHIDLIGDDVEGEVRILAPRHVVPESMVFEVLATSCNAADEMEFFVNGVSLGTLVLDAEFTCSCNMPVQRLVIDDVMLLKAAWKPDGGNRIAFVKPGGPTFVSWVRARLGEGSSSRTECLFDFQDGECTVLSVCDAGTSNDALSAEITSAEPLVGYGVVSAAPFSGSELPRFLGIDAVADGSARACVVVPSAFSPDQPQDCADFTKQGEIVLAINGVACGPPTAVAGTDFHAECTSPRGALVTLDGSASTSIDSTPGTNDGIVLFEWFENFGTNEQTLLGQTEVLEVTMPLGDHRIRLRVTDGAGLTAMDELLVSSIDTTPPELRVTLEPLLLWPPDHRMVEMIAGVSASDLCGEASFELVSISSSEPDDAPGLGDGRTVHDIQNDAANTPDVEFALRAERAGNGRGRVYTVRYRALDGSLLTSEKDTLIVVPHDQRRVTGPDRTENE